MTVTIKEWYQRVNATWPKPVPPLTEAAARNAAKRLWRWGTGTRLTMPIVITSGRRYTWTYQGTLRVNASGGWDRFIHDLSHLLWSRVNPGVRAHEKGHAKFELRMRKEVLKRGWLVDRPLGELNVVGHTIACGSLNGATCICGKGVKEPEKIEPAPAPHDVRVEKHARVLASIARWEKKLARAETALAKLRRRERGLRRHLQLVKEKAS